MVLQAHNLGVEFNGKWIFRDASISVDAGDRLALVGPSGSGKSILLKSLAMLHPFDEGSIKWNGDAVCGSAIPLFRSSVMYVPQRSADTDGTVIDFLEAPFSFSIRAGTAFEPDKASQLLEALGRSKEFLSKPQRELSGGERQISSLVRSLLLDPQVLLLDEPTSAMDGPTVSKAEKLIQSWCSKDSTRSTLWVTHDLQQANRVATALIEMDQLSNRGA